MLGKNKKCKGTSKGIIMCLRKTWKAVVGKGQVAEIEDVRKGM